MHLNSALRFQIALRDMYTKDFTTFGWKWVTKFLEKNALHEGSHTTIYDPGTIRSADESQSQRVERIEDIPGKPVNTHFCTCLTCDSLFKQVDNLHCPT